ncbi:MAG: hypothetical protein QG625_4233 [Cyanobacteriota bacterium erpe_2018_sw_39hr_WHONDRS-SW48-000098_B_bin.30]|nr:hypothetical protein [Cyanobacteriota bacterium erpe_2018_sw_39hr_WHONDRS-SW48-000098_B_bin.30]
MRRAANGASRDELGLIGDIRRNNLVVGPNRYWVPLTTATLDSRFRPNSAVDTPSRNVANLAH